LSAQIPPRYCEQLDIGSNKYSSTSGGHKVMTVLFISDNIDNFVEPLTLDLVFITVTTTNNV